MSMFRIKIYTLLSLFLGINCSVFAQPDVPTNLWDYPIIDSVPGERGKFNRPHIPPLLLSNDGRLGVRIHHKPNNMMTMLLLAPEKISNPFLASRPGTPIMAKSKRELSPERLGTTSTLPSGAFFICEDPAAPNPFVCGKDKDKDCYDISLIGREDNKEKKEFRMVSNKLRVVVSNPKTPRAAIENIRFLEEKPVVGPPMTSFYNEPTVTSDGMLLVAKFGRWVHKESGVRQYNSPVGYAYNKKGACDVTGWTEAHPATHAYFDPDVNQRYGFAKYQMRDTEGNLIPNGAVLDIDQYPWVDPKGDNIFMALGVDMLLYYDEDNIVRSRYPAKCLSNDKRLCNVNVNSRPQESGFDPDDDQFLDIERSSNVNRNISFFGSWTRGKIVTMDNLINYMDYGMNWRHLLVKLYKPGTSTKNSDNPINLTGEVKMAHNKTFDAYTPLGSVYEGAQLGSVTNTFNYLENLTPKTPRDIVWFFSKGNGGTAELAFDDFIDPNVFIYSPMNQSFAHNNDPNGKRNVWHDGFERERDKMHGKGFAKKEGTLGRFQNPLRMQNAATRDARAAALNGEDVNQLKFWDLPPYGEVVGRFARVEPYALGGIEGKGFWMDGNSRVIYPIPEQNNRDLQEQKNWYYGIFIDPRNLKDQLNRTLISFPDGSKLSLVGRDNIDRVAITDRSGQSVENWVLPRTISPERWVHLGFAVEHFDGGTKVTPYFNGFADRALTIQSEALLALEEGNLTLGKRGKGDGFIGWIDDFKVISRALTQEEYCNHARGTLVRIRENVFWNRIASRYPRSSHKAIAEQVGDDGSVRYACYVNYNVERGANMAQIPRGTESLREEVLDIHRLAFNEARPDSSENAFCKSCHVESDGPLSLQALKYLGLPAQEDDRRQPMQPNPLIYGIIPPNLFGPGLPVRRINDDVRQKKPRGHFVDEWVLDNSQ